jgi:hypothetical protein
MTTDSDMNEIEMHGLLERLVASELDEADRARVLAWLDADAGRWRLCGLAFLEAQTWSETLGAWTSGKRTQVELPAPRSTDRFARLRRGLSIARASALVTAVVVAFTAGVITRGMWTSPGTGHEPSTTVTEDNDPSIPVAERVESPSDEGPLMATVALPRGATSVPAAEMRFPVVKGDSTLSNDGSMLPQLPDYVRQQWERRGYKFDAQRRYLLARLPDGEQVAVPIERLLVKYVGNKVY